jgi:quercetin dioxygenase-like cupin family protein
MPIIKSEVAPRFELPGVTFTGLASPARGARETSVWRIAMAPGTPGTPHSVDREEIFIATAGRAQVTLAGEAHELAAGDALVVPAGVAFALANPHTEPFEAVAALPVGGKAVLPNGEAFVPPWVA